MPTVVGANVIERDGRVLVVREGKPAVGGRWNLPSGRLEPGETPVACARREAREETGLEVTPTALVGVYLDRDETVDGEVLVHVFRSTATDGLPTVPADDSVTDLAWVTAEELEALDRRAAYVARAVADARSGGLDADRVVDLT